MKVARNQFTLGSLMVLIAAVAGLLVLPSELRYFLLLMVLVCVLLQMLVMLAFGLESLASWAIFRIGKAFGHSLPGKRPKSLRWK